MFQTRGPSSVIIQLCLLKHTCMHVQMCVNNMPHLHTFNGFHTKVAYGELEYVLCHLSLTVTHSPPFTFSTTSSCQLFLSLLYIYIYIYIYCHTLLLNIFTMAINILVTCIEKLQVQHACEYGLLSSVRTHELPISPPPPLIIFLHQHLLFLHSSIHMLQIVW